MRFGIALGTMHPSMFVAAAEAADDLGFESLWFPEHLVLPVAMAGSPFAGAEHPPVPPSTPVFDVLAYLAFLAGRTRRIRLGTHVYNLALRHPFVAARAVQTVDVVSGGRLEARSRCRLAPFGMGGGRFRLLHSRSAPRRGAGGVPGLVERGDDRASRPVLLVRQCDVRAQAAAASPSAGEHWG